MMRFIIFYLVYFSTSISYSQGIDSRAIRKARLLYEIKQSNQVESYCLGFACTVSKLCLKVDSLFMESDFNEIVSFFDDTSYVLKYYVFQYLASKNDTVAFEKLKIGIADSTIIFTHINCVMWGSEKYNELLIQEYMRFIKFKYYYGGSISFDYRTYNYGKRNKSVWRKKKNSLLQLLKKNHIKYQEI